MRVGVWEKNVWIIGKPSKQYKREDFRGYLNIVNIIPPSHFLFGISRNQAEPAGMKNFQNSRQGISNPGHTRGGMRRNDGGMEILYIFLDMRFGGVLNYIRPDFIRGPIGTFSTEFEPHSSGGQSKDSSDIWIAFQLNYFNIELDSGSNRNAFEVHSGSFEAHSGHSGRIEVACRFDSPSKAVRMFRFSFEGDQNVSNAVGMP